LLWQAIRIPVLAVLVVLEPIVAFVLTAIALLGIFVALVLKLSGAVPHFHFVLMLAFSVGSAVLLFGYYALLRLFSR
jgi:hypothetical protein